VDSIEWRQRRITDSAQNILKQIPSRAAERGLHVVDGASIVILALWSLLLWERKVGLRALEESGADRFDLVHGLDRLLEEKASDHPVAFDNQRAVFVLVKTDLPLTGWDFKALLEPLLRQAEHEANELGHDHVGSEHLVLAILVLADPTLRPLLQQHGISHKQVKQKVISLLQT
jgi:ATP-dependent Clp protease ATP-binding subunit ClpA